MSCSAVATTRPAGRIASISAGVFSSTTAPWWHPPGNARAADRLRRPARPGSRRRSSWPTPARNPGCAGSAAPGRSTRRYSNRGRRGQLTWYATIARYIPRPRQSVLVAAVYRPAKSGPGPNATTAEQTGSSPASASTSATRSSAVAVQLADVPGPARAAGHQVPGSASTPAASLTSTRADGTWPKPVGTKTARSTLPEISRLVAVGAASPLVVHLRRGGGSSPLARRSRRRRRLRSAGPPRTTGGQAGDLDGTKTAGRSQCSGHGSVAGTRLDRAHRNAARRRSRSITGTDHKHGAGIGPEEDASLDGRPIASGYLQRGPTRSGALEEEASERQHLVIRSTNLLGATCWRCCCRTWAHRTWLLRRLRGRVLRLRIHYAGITTVATPACRRGLRGGFAGGFVRAGRDGAACAELEPGRDLQAAGDRRRLAAGGQPGDGHVRG